MRPGVVPGLSFAALALAGCAVGPDYRAPAASQVDAPPGWHAPLPRDTQAAKNNRWWDLFGDPVLTSLIADADKSSPTVALAEGRMREARALLDATRSSYFPVLTGTAGATRSNGTGAVSNTAESGAVQNQLSAGLSLLWDLDLFGRTRRGVEGGNARLESIAADALDARVSLAANVALAYAQRRQCEALLEQDRVDLDSRMATHRLTADKVNAGFAAPADALRTEASVAEGRATLQGVQGQCAQLLNQLVALTGTPARSVEARLGIRHASIPLPPRASIEEIPAQVLSQRPDIASAERALAAASADIGVAVASRYPSIQLLGAIGRDRLSLGGATMRVETWSFGPSLSVPLFDAGFGAAQVEAARARYDQALALYRQRVRIAVQDVEDSLVRTDVALERERSAALADARYQSYFQAKESQYKLGAASLLDLEDARRLTVGSRLLLASAQLERAQAWISLYRAAGGAWQRPEGEPNAMIATTPVMPQDRP